MKFVFITAWYGTASGGLELEFKIYSEWLVQAGFSVEVLTTCCKNPYLWNQTDCPQFPSGTEVHNKITIHRFKVNAINDLPEAPLPDGYTNESQWEIDHQYHCYRYTQGSTSDDLLDYIATYDEKTIFVCGPYFQALSYLAITRYPKRVYLRSAFHNEPQIKWLPVKDMIINAKGLLIGTEQEKNLAILHHGKVAGRQLIEQPVIGVPVPLPCFSPAIKNDQYQLPKQYYIYVGRKDPGKGLLQLIKWYQGYIDQYQGSLDDAPALVFIGSGNSELIPKHHKIIDLGYVNTSDKNIMISKALGLINLSTNESFSLVIMEAWLCATPVIVPASCSVTAHHCLKSQGGLIVDSLDSFCQALDRLKNPLQRQQYAQNGKQYVLNHYLTSTVANQFLDMITV